VSGRWSRRDWPSVEGWLAIAFFLLLPLEGVLRKWVVGDAEQIFGFIRDPIVFAIYCLAAVRAGIRVPTWAAVFLLVAGLFVAYDMMFALWNDMPLYVTMLGVRAYVFYIPMAFILGERLTATDLRWLTVIALGIAIPIAALVFLQFVSPVESPINKDVSEELTGRFVVVAGIVRPYGPFTFTQAQAHFTALTVAIVMIAWESRVRMRIPILLLAAAAAATLVMGAFSGARTFFGLAGLVCAAYLVAGLSSPAPDQSIARLTSMAAGLAAFAFVFVFMFPDSYAAMSQRQTEAEEIEGSTLDRALEGFDISKELAAAPAFGYGAGSGSNAVTVIAGLHGFVYGETEWGRMINELGPVVGLLAIAFRVWITLWLGWRCLRINRIAGDGAGLILFGFTGYMLLYAQTTGQNQNLSFCWLAAGMTIAFCRLAERRRAAGQARHAPARRARGTEARA
jgi:hypothetical protein